MRIEEALTELLQETGPYALAALFGASLIEYVFPPFPGDSVVVFGAFYATHGVLPLPLVFLAVTAGSVAGAAIDYALGRKLAAVRDRPLANGAGRFLRVGRDRLEKVEAAYRRHGDLCILANRFLPGIRGFFFVAAGMAGIPFRRVMALGTISAAVWNGLLLAAGWAVGENLDELLVLFRTWSFAAWGLVFLVAALLLGRWALSRRNDD